VTWKLGAANLGVHPSERRRRRRRRRNKVEIHRVICIQLNLASSGSSTSSSLFMNGRCGAAKQLNRPFSQSDDKSNTSINSWATLNLMSIRGIEREGGKEKEGGR